jgi:putative membrane protein
MMQFKSSLLAAAVTAALAAGSVQAQGGPSSPMPSSPAGAAAQGTGSAPGTRAADAGAKSTLTAADRQFVMEAAMGGMAEVQAGQLAAQKAQNPQVRAFAQKMVDDHTKANGELMRLASARSITPPSELDRSHRSALDKLQKASGPDFDKAYMKQQVSDHEKTVSLFEKQAKRGSDPELKAWAAKMLPDLQSHLKMARSDMTSTRRGDTTTQQGSASAASGGTSAPGTSGVKGGSTVPGASGSAASAGTSGPAAGSASAGGATGTRAPAGTSPSGTTGATGASGGAGAGSGK